VDASRRNDVRILIVDASADVRALLRRQLPDLDETRFAFDEAGSGHEAVEKLERLSFDCVLVDCSLEGGGVEWVARLRQAAPAVPIVALSAEGSEELAVACWKRGAHDYLNKGRLAETALRDAVLAAIEKSLQLQILEGQKQKLLRRRTPAGADATGRFHGSRNQPTPDRTHRILPTAPPRSQLPPPVCCQSSITLFDRPIRFTACFNRSGFLLPKSCQRRRRDRAR